jgi:hypothetical protein
MPVSRLAAVRRRLIAIAVATAVASGLAVAGLLAPLPAAQSSTRFAGEVTAPDVVARVVIDTLRVGLAKAEQKAEQQDELAHTLVVFGDSISARYNNRGGDAEQGFWSMVAHELGARPEVRAEGGAGFVNPGLVGCVGRTFADQLARPGMAEVVAGAGAVIIEGGRTDTQTCRAGGGYDLVSHRQVRRAVDAFMAEVQRLRGPDSACTIVVVPWGPKGLPENRDRVTRVVANGAHRHGFTFVETRGILTDDNTIDDRVHPTRRGNRELTRAILEGSDARACFS